MINATQIFYLNEIGGRANLEDSIYPLPGRANRADHVYLVCDGVGGLSKGEEASRIVTATVGQILSRIKNVSEADVLAAIQAAQDQMREYIKTNSDGANMSTTLTLAAIRENDILIAWSGDSRIKHIRDGNILYQTEDHSLVRQLVRQGDITEAEAAIHPKRNVILRAVNADEDPDDPDFHVITDIKNGDWLLLCTDGVLENLTPDGIKSICKQGATIDHLQISFDALCKNKTNDNYSLYLLQLEVANTIAPTTKLPQKKQKLNILPVILLGALALAAIIFMAYKYFQVKPAPPAVMSVAKVPEIVNSGPSFPGGDSAWVAYCNTELHYPRKALKKEKQGRVIVRFMVDTSGAPSEYKHLTHLGSGLEQELQRVISKAKWMPAKENNKLIDDTLTIGWQYVLPDSIGGGIKPF